MSGVVDDAKRTIQKTVNPVNWLRDPVGTIKSTVNDPANAIGGVLGKNSIVGKAFDMGVTQNTGNLVKASDGFFTGIKNGNLGQAVGGAFSPFVQHAKGLTGEFMQGVSGQPNMPAVNVADPQAVADEQSRQRAAAARQTQIDTMTNKPGRGGTILTDTYQYKV